MALTSVQETASIKSPHRRDKLFLHTAHHRKQDIPQVTAKELQQS